MPTRTVAERALLSLESATDTCGRVSLVPNSCQFLSARLNLKLRTLSLRLPLPVTPNGTEASQRRVDFELGLKLQP